MSMMRYCPKCGNIGIRIENGCTFCGHDTLETKYTFKEHLNSPEIDKKIVEEYIQNSPEFDEELFNKRTEEEDAIAHGRGTPMTYQKDVPKCPTCGSTNIKRITTLDRAVSVGTLGLLSGKIGKNYECLDCKAKW